MIPLSKVMDMPLDAGRFSSFVQEILQPGRYDDLLAGQHPARAWEYGMALEAIHQWEHQQPMEGDPLQILDAGSASSNLWQALTAFTSEDIRRVDPQLSGVAAELGQYINIPEDLAGYATKNPARHGRIDVITAISVIEHIPDYQESAEYPSALQAFLLAAHALLRPGALLVLTTDYRETGGPDTSHFHWMRERIYNPLAFFGDLSRRIEAMGFLPFGGWDPTWHGPQLYDYAMASLVMVKKGS